MSAKLLGYVAIGVMVLLQLYCQLIFKWRINPANGIGNEEPVQLILKFLTDPWILSGIVAAFGGMLAWIFALSRIELSVAYPIAAIVIPVVAVLGIFLFGESIGIVKATGIALVFAGALCVGLG